MPTLFRVMFYKIIYSIFIFCASVLSLQHYGIPVTPRQLLAIIMFFVCLNEEKKLWCDRIFAIYAVFIFFYGVASISTGYVVEFFLRLIGDYFVAYVALWSIKLLITKYDSLNVFFYTLICIGLFDGMVSICQFLGFSYLDSILNRFQLISYEPFLENYQGTGVAMLTKPTPGIFSHPTLNGHFLGAAAVLSTFFVSRKNYIATVPLVFFMIVSLFATQQRTVFAMGLVSIATLFFMVARKSKYRLIIFPLVVFVIAFLGMKFYFFVANGDFRFTELALDSTGRDDIYKEGFEFIKNNPLGGINEYVEGSGAYPHNLFLNAFIYGGWLGGLILIYIVILQVFQVAKTMFNWKKAPIFEVILALAFITLTINGLTHNQSIVNAEIITWSVWGAFYYSRNKKYVRKENHDGATANEYCITNG